MRNGRARRILERSAFRCFSRSHSHFEAEMDAGVEERCSCVCVWAMGCYRDGVQMEVCNKIASCGSVGSVVCSRQQAARRSLAVWSSATGKSCGVSVWGWIESGWV